MAVAREHGREVELAAVCRPPTLLDGMRRQARGDPVPILVHDADVAYGADFLDLLVDPIAAGSLYSVGFKWISDQQRAVGCKFRRAPGILSLAMLLDQIRHEIDALA